MLHCNPVRIDLACPACGNNHFSLTEAEEDSTLVQCEDCGHLIGTLGELKQMVADAVLRRKNCPT